MVLDAPARRVLGRPLDVAAGHLARIGVTPNHLTAIGFVLGIAAAVAAARSAWPIALALWLTSRLGDGLDGAVARVVGPTDAGGYLDVVADFTVYGAFVVGVAIAVPEARVACAVLLLTYYVNGTAVLAFSGLADRRALDRPDERSVRLGRGLAEGTETIVVHALFCLLPSMASGIAWSFAGVVAVTATSRIVGAVRVLRRP